MGQISKMGLLLFLFGAILVLSVWFFAFHSPTTSLAASVGALLWTALLGAIILFGLCFAAIGALMLLV